LQTIGTFHDSLAIYSQARYYSHFSWIWHEISKWVVQNSLSLYMCAYTMYICAHLCVSPACENLIALSFLNKKVEIEEEIGG